MGMANSKQPSTLLEAIRYYSDEQVAFDYVVKLRWPTGKPVCPRCGCMDVSFLSTRNIWKCQACVRQFSVRVGSIFEDSPLPFSKWLPAIWLIVNSKNGISSCELGRAIGVTQKSAWHMLHRIRLAMTAGSFEKMSGTVEIDETFVGGLSRNMHKSARAKLTGTGGVDKTIVVGALVRSTGNVKSRVRAEVRSDRSLATLTEFVKFTAHESATVYTDAHAGYNGVVAANYLHAIIDHSVGYVNGQVHTNGIESFWNLFKRGAKGTYTHMAPKNMNRYVAERVFAFNEREISDAERMRKAVQQVGGRRLTYAELAA
jgi:transposase-like protein